MHKSRSVTSNQNNIHDDLLQIVDKHVESVFERPIPDVAAQSFNGVKNVLVGNPKPLIFDSGCGVGRSTRILAEHHPDHWVVGIDQSVHRLNKSHLIEHPDNMLLVRANLVDFWRLAVAEKWRLEKHFLLYPNPWPKKQHIKRRWHAHPVFPLMLALKGTLELRTNWSIYAQEMKQTLEHLGRKVESVELYEPEHFLTPFEEKYKLSGQQLFRLIADLS